MRPDRKKRNRGKHTEKSEDTQGQDKNVVSKVVPEKEEAANTNTGESKEQSHTESTDKAKPSTSTSPAKEVLNDNLPAPTLRRETDALKETKKPCKRQIFSDWKEYDKPILPEEVEEEHLHDFSSLIQQNITGDNYFKFKHERQWENDTYNLNKDLFNLNLQELSAGLQCIPFYERLNISTDLFSTNEVKRMEKCAKEQEKIYDGILNSQECNPIYKNLMDKLSKEPEIQQEEQYNVEVGKDLTPKPSVSQGGNLQMESELFVKCLTSEKQNSVDETFWTQPKETKVKENQLNFFMSDDKPLVEDDVRKNNSVEDKPHLSQEENASVAESNSMSTPINELEVKHEIKEVAETNINSISTPVNGLEVKHEIKEVIMEPTVKPSDDTPIDADITTSPMDMDSAFESSPLGQRVKPRRSRETKAKSKSKVVSPGEEDEILDSLLSLKEPTITADDSKKKEMEEAENEGDNLTNDLKSIVIHEKKENLEAWLDSMLDD